MIIEKKRLWFRTIELMLEDDKVPEVVAQRAYDLVAILTYDPHPPQGFSTKHKTTAFIDLTCTEEEVMARMSDTTRNEIRRTYRNPDLSFSGPEMMPADVYAMYQDFERAQGRRSYAYGDISRFPCFTARFKDMPVSAITVLEAKPFIRIRSIFSARLGHGDVELRKVIGNASRRVMWEICVWGKGNGFTSLDLASVNLTEEGKRGISSFKLSFGGQIGDEYLHVYKSPMYRFFETGMSWLRKLRA